jgi:transposase
MRNHCPKCKYHWSWNLADGRKKCRSCGHRYVSQSIWEAYRLPEKTKKKLLDYFVLGVPVYRLRFKNLGNRKTIERFFRIIRIVLLIAEQYEPMLEGIIECDEALFGGKRKGKRGWGAKGKILVFGMMKRNGKVRVMPVSSRETETLIPLIQIHTKPGSLYYTDDWHAYGSLRLRGNHVIIKKEDGRPKGRDHINGIEGFWSYANHWLYHYRGIHKKFFPIYLAELSYRFNHQDKDIFPLIYKLLQQYHINDFKNILVR